MFAHENRMILFCLACVCFASLNVSGFAARDRKGRPNIHLPFFHETPIGAGYVPYGPSLYGGLTYTIRNPIIVSMVRNKAIIDSSVSTETDFQDTRVFELQADICLALANPKRLQILNLLKNGEMSAGEMVKAMKVAKANLSQHLSILRQKGIVLTRREGTNIYYRIAHPKITEACSIMRGLLMESLKTQGILAERIIAGVD
jgi:ArsR family transcriptional regulator, virulence genes transcriptional regulator